MRLLLTDSTMPMSFCKAGIGCARAMCGYLDEKVHMVEDVHVELLRLAEGLPALDSLLSDWPPNPVRRLDPDLKTEVAAAIKAKHIPGQHLQEDRGEIATVLYATAQRALGNTYGVITDDRYGKDLVRDRDLELVTTPDLIFTMIQAGALVKKDGERVWRECVGRKSWGQFGRVLSERTRIQS
jgi:hypothetical protein